LSGLIIFITLPARNISLPKQSVKPVTMIRAHRKHVMEKRPKLPLAEDRITPFREIMR